MRKQPVRPHPGDGGQPHPLWMRLVTIFCLALLGISSTVQVCHTHDDPFEPSLRSHSAAVPPAAHLLPATQPGLPGSNAAVLCPLCVAMHSALPVTQSLTQLATLRVELTPVLPTEAPRVFLWRSELASRPPPPSPSLA